MVMVDGRNLYAFSSIKRGFWWYINPDKGGDIQLARSCLVGVRSDMDMVDQTTRIILMGKKEGMP